MSEFVVRKENPPQIHTGGHKPSPDPKWLSLVINGGGDWFAIEEWIIKADDSLNHNNRAICLRVKFNNLKFTVRTNRNADGSKTCTYYARLKTKAELTNGDLPCPTK